MGYNLALTALAEPRHFWFHGFRAYVLPVIRDIVGDRRDLRMIDCGCGTGYNIKTLLQPNGRAFAFDMSLDALQRARSSGRPLAQADMERIPFRSATFDLAISFDVVQSVSDDTAAVREMARVLKPGGHLVMNVTALEFLRGDHSDVWGEQRRYTRDSGTRLVEGAGLDVVGVAYLFASLVPMMLTVRMVQRALRLVREPSGDTELAVPAPPINALLTGLVRAEAAVARRLPMPFGSSLLVVARKPTA
ncbi:MAG: class I SAM-dependent methyltransferase [Acidobacteria bacterium]|nr:class I SAM-dependent methyltransferase [Acidobacteriota bacterium]